LREIANPGYFSFLISQRSGSVGGEAPEFLLNEAEHKLENLIKGASDLLKLTPVNKNPCGDFKKKISSIYSLTQLENYLGKDIALPLQQLIHWMSEKASNDTWLATFCWVFFDCLRDSLGLTIHQFIKQISLWRFQGILESALWEMGPQVSSPTEVSHFIEMLMRLDGWLSVSTRRNKGKTVRLLLSDDFIGDFLKINEYGGRTWFGKNSAETIFFLMGIKGMMEIITKENQTRKKKLRQMEIIAEQILDFKNTAESSGYDLDRFLKILDQE